MSLRSRAGDGPRSFTRTSPADGLAAVDLLDTKSVVCARLGGRLRGRQDQPRQYRRHECEAPHVPSPTTRRAAAACGSLQNCEPNYQNSSQTWRTGADCRGVPGHGANRVPGRAVGYTSPPRLWKSLGPASARGPDGRRRERVGSWPVPAGQTARPRRHGRGVSRPRPDARPRRRHQVRRSRQGRRRGGRPAAAARGPRGRGARPSLHLHRLRNRPHA